MSTTFLVLAVFSAASPLPPQEAETQKPQAELRSTPHSAAGARFAAPVQLAFDGNPLSPGIQYPSPRLFDLDGDGRMELVLGELHGRVRVARRAEGAEPTAWGPLEPLSTDDRPLVFHNW